MASLVIGPTGRNPDYAHGENQYAEIIGAQTAVLVSAGGGFLHTVTVGVTGTLITFYDVKAGGTTDATTQIAVLTLTDVTRETATLDVAFSQGLTAIVTGGATTAVNVSFRGAQTVSPRTFGTQLDGNAGRLKGTSTDHIQGS